jgi:hypothetical protein
MPLAADGQFSRVFPDIVGELLTIGFVKVTIYGYVK